MGWAGLGLGVYITHGRYGLHQRLGIAIQILGTFQVLLGSPPQACMRPAHWLKLV